MAAAPATIGAGPAKLKIKIKGLSVLGAKQKAQQQQVSTGRYLLHCMCWLEQQFSTLTCTSSSLTSAMATNRSS
jgi:hypothetical protein